jgi:hypothetical protein
MPMRFFFYGTLLDPGMRRLVLGAGLPDPALEPAELASHRAVLARGQRYPILMKSTIASVRGAVTQPVDLETAERLVFYEGPDYRMVKLPVRLAAGGSVEAVVFVPFGGLKPSTVAWNLARWQHVDKPQTLRRIAGWMAAYQPSPAALAGRRRDRSG